MFILIVFKIMMQVVRRGRGEGPSVKRKWELYDYRPANKREVDASENVCGQKHINIYIYINWRQEHGTNEQHSFGIACSPFIPGRIFIDPKGLVILQCVYV